MRGEKTDTFQPGEEEFQEDCMEEMSFTYLHSMCASKVSWRERKNRAFQVERKQNKEKYTNRLNAVVKHDVNTP